MKKLIFVLIAALGVSCTSYAQMTEKELKKAVKTAQKTVKEARNDLENEAIMNKSNAKRLMDQAVKNPLLQDWDETWVQAAAVYETYYRNENEKSYTGGLDTVAMYNYLDKFVQYVMKADSIQQIPNAKGKISDGARKRFGVSVHNNLTQFISGGIFYFNHRVDYKMAYYFFDKYFTLAQTDFLKEYMVEDYTWNNDRTTYAYYPALAAYNFGDYEKTLKYAKIAQEGEEYGNDATQFVCECYGNLKDTVNWLASLKDGLVKYPTEEWYYNKLLVYYNDKGDMSELETFVEDMIKIDPEKSYNYYVLGYVAQQSENWDKAIEQYKIAIEKDPTLADAYNNLGLCIIQKADAEMESKSNLDYRSAAYKKAIQAHKDQLEVALPYFIKLRELEPDSVGKWGIPLQNIYYQLDKRKELDEVEARMKAAGLI